MATGARVSASIVLLLVVVGEYLKVIPGIGHSVFEAQSNGAYETLYAYVITAGATLYIVFPAVGVGSVSFGQALAAYCFGLAFYLILGSLEAASVAAFLVVGVSKSDAVTAIVINRGLTLGGTLVLALVAMAVLYDEFRAVLWPTEDGRREAEGGRRQTAEAATPVERRWER